MSHEPSSTYRFQHPGIAAVLRDLYIGPHEPGPGDEIGPFEMPTTDGRWLRSSELAAAQTPVLLVFGSATCPIMVSGLDRLKTLHAQFGSKVRFVLVQVREAHPGAAIPQPGTMEQKQRHAVHLQQKYGVPFEVAVDDIDGTLHRRLGGRPNSAYLLSSSGIILFRAQWANRAAAIESALASLSTGRMPLPATVTHSFPAVLQSVGFTTPVLTTAGDGARLDFWKIALPVALLVTFSDLLFFVPRAKRGAVILAAVLGALVGLVYLPW